MKPISWNEAWSRKWRINGTSLNFSRFLLLSLIVLPFVLYGLSLLFFLPVIHYDLLFFCLFLSSLPNFWGRLFLLLLLYNWFGQTKGWQHCQCLARKWWYCDDLLKQTLIIYRPLYTNQTELNYRNLSCTVNPFQSKTVCEPPEWDIRFVFW